MAKNIDSKDETDSLNLESLKDLKKKYRLKLNKETDRIELATTSADFIKFHKGNQNQVKSLLENFIDKIFSIKIYRRIFIKQNFDVIDGKPNFKESKTDFKIRTSGNSKIILKHLLNNSFKLQGEYTINDLSEKYFEIGIISSNELSQPKKSFSHFIGINIDGKHHMKGKFTALELLNHFNLDINMSHNSGILKIENQSKKIKLEGNFDASDMYYLFLSFKNLELSFSSIK